MINKIVFSILFSVIAYITTHAQDIQATAVYVSKTNTVDISTGIKSNKSITPEMQQKIEEKMKTLFDKTFILNFNKITSTYLLTQKPETSGQQSGAGSKMASAILDGGTYFKNIKDKTFAVDKKIMDKEYLVQDVLTELPWKLDNETKIINGYTCYKATAVRKPGAADFRHFKPKKQEGQNSDADNSKKNSILDQVDVPNEIVVTAWYAPDIPFGHGPENYWGLPGLILEINDGKTTITCTQVTLNPKDKAIIKAPATGTPISQKQYEEMLLKKLSELQQIYLSKMGQAGK